MKKFETPVIDVVKLAVTDVITTSQEPGGSNNWGGGGTGL